MWHRPARESVPKSLRIGKPVDAARDVGKQQARDAGKRRQEGKDYVVRDGGVVLCRFNV